VVRWGGGYVAHSQAVSLFRCRCRGRHAGRCAQGLCRIRHCMQPGTPLSAACSPLRAGAAGPTWRKT